MHLLQASVPLELVAIDILCEVVNTRRGNHFLLEISVRLSKLTRTIPMKTIMAASVLHAFVTHWVMDYGPSIWLLTDNGKQFSAKIFQDVFRLLGTENMFTTTDHPQANGQVERFNTSILKGLRSYIADHLQKYYLYTGVLIYAYNTKSTMYAL